MHEASAAGESQIVTEQHVIQLLPGGQELFYECDALHPALLSGRGGGKTTISVIKAVTKFALKYPGIRGVLTEPSYPKVRDVLVPEFRQQFGFIEGTAWNYRKGDNEVEFSNGSVIMLRSADNQELGRGPNIGFFGMDEVAEPTTNGSQEEAFLLLQAALRQQGFPLQGWVTSTPRGQRHWLYRRWVKKLAHSGGELPEEDYPFFMAKTADNHFLPERYLPNLQISYGGSRFAAQELEGEFVILAGAAFPSFNPSVHVRHVPDKEWVRTIGGGDFGVVAPTAIYEVKIARAPNGVRPKVHVAREFYKSHASFGEMADWIKGTDIGATWWDKSAADCIRQLNKLGCTAYKCASNNFHDRISTFGSYMELDPDGEPYMTISPECTHLIEEIGSAEFAGQSEDGGGDDRWTRSTSDHGIDGTTYALQQVGRFVGAPQQIQAVYA